MTADRDWGCSYCGCGEGEGGAGGNMADIGILILCGLRQRFRDVKSM